MTRAGTPSRGRRPMRAQGYCAAVAAWLLAGCTTNYYLVDEMAARPPQAYPETVQLVPSADAKASALLQHTTLYRIAPQAAVTLRDANLQFSGGCGNPLLASGLTLGLLPVSIPEGGRLVYRLQHDGRASSMPMIFGSSAVPRCGSGCSRRLPTARTRSGSRGCSGRRAMSSTVSMVAARIPSRQRSTKRRRGHEVGWCCQGRRLVWPVPVAAAVQRVTVADPPAQR